MKLWEIDLHYRSHRSDRLFTIVPICLHQVLKGLVLLWSLTKGCFSSCQPQQVLVVVDLHTPKIPKYHNVYHVAHLSTSSLLTFSSGNYQIYLFWKVLHFRSGYFYTRSGCFFTSTLSLSVWRCKTTKSCTSHELFGIFSTLLWRMVIVSPTHQQYP